MTWELGRSVLERYLIDHDLSVNNFSWQWLSSSAYFEEYSKCYGPVVSFQRTDPSGRFHFISLTPSLEIKQNFRFIWTGRLYWGFSIIKFIIHGLLQYTTHNNANVHTAVRNEIYINQADYSMLKFSLGAK